MLIPGNHNHGFLSIGLREREREREGGEEREGERERGRESVLETFNQSLDPHPTRPPSQDPPLEDRTMTQQLKDSNLVDGWRCLALAH